MKLILKDGTVFEGKSFGAPLSGKETLFGEVVFNTGMTGYVESLSDPSYAGQILILTYPLVGNYGVPDKKFFESSKMQNAGLVVAEYSEEHSHYSAKKSLAQWCKDSGVPAITGIDTRALTIKLREHGVMLGKIIDNGRSNPIRTYGRKRPTSNGAGKFQDPNEENLVAKVSTKKKEVIGSGKVTIVAIDCGMKENIVRSLSSLGARVIRVPWDYDFTKEKYDGLFISNGPGDPTMCGPTVENIRKAMVAKKPILGICLGNQLLALAAGGKTYKLKYGHRSQNQPCINLDTERCYITSQNHGFAVDEKSLPSEWDVWFTNANDGSVEGIRHKSRPWRAVQFHPEASPGPTDTAWIFEEFISQITSERGHRAKPV